MKIIIDSRMRKKEKEYLSQFGEIIEISPQNIVYDEISGHPDIFFAQINNVIFKAPNFKMNQLFNYINGEEDVGMEYPQDIKYNICQIGNNIIHNFKYTDKKILEYIDKNHFRKYQVNQGYSKCNTSVINDKVCITSDYGIYKTLNQSKIDCLYLEEHNIKLLDRKGTETSMKGFIGGASCTINNKFILFGDSNYLNNKEKLVRFLNKYNIELIDFVGLSIHDYGGIIRINT